MKQTSIVCFALAVLCLFQLCCLIHGRKGDTIILGGHGHGCHGPKLLLKTDKRKKGDIILINEGCKHEKKEHYIPYPVYHQSHESHESYGGGHGYGHGGGYGGHGGYGHDDHGYGY